MAHQQNPEVDAGLSVLCILAEDGQTLSYRDMAEVCGCSPQLLHNTAVKAINKLRRSKRLEELARDL